MRALILLLFLMSGFAGLAYELVWVKELSLILGVSSGAISTVLAAFMGGLALGSALLGRIADSTPRPLRMYALLEIGIGISALLLHYALRGVNSAYISLASAMPEANWLFVMLRYLLCFAVLLVPTALMGGTLPAMSRVWVRTTDRIGAGVGLLYGTNALGGVLGTLAVGFVLLRTLGVADTTRLAVALNLTAGLVCLWLARSWGAAQMPASPGRTSAEAAREPFTDWQWLLLGAFALAGATSLAYEVLWTRVLVYFTGQTIYAFSTILASYLIGLALGSLAAARLTDRIRDHLAAFGLLEIAIGISAAYLLLVIGRLSVLSEAVRGALPWTGWWASFGVTFALMLVPTLLMGAVMPVVTRAYTSRVEQLGRRLGVLYAANTAGCVAGSLGAGFLLLGWLGAQRAVLVVAAVNVALGLAIVAFSRRRRWAKSVISLTATALLLFGVVLSWQARPAVMYRVDYVRGGDELLYYRESSEASLAVLASPGGHRELNLNGSGTAFTNYTDMVVHRMLGHVPMLLADSARSALVIGFGLGATAWSIWQYPVEQIDCVELVEQEREAAEFFLAENGGILEKERFRMILADGRNHLLTTRESYDIVSVNAINPRLSPYLYTREFYELCRRRLRPGGVMCAWVPTNMSTFPSLVATFQEVFPHTSVWLCNPCHALLVATPEELKIDLEVLSERMSRPDIRGDLATVQLDDPVRLLSTLLANEEQLREYTGGAPINRDNLPYVEFDTEISEIIGFQHVAALMASRARPWDLVVGAVSPDARARLERYWAAAPELARGQMADWVRAWRPAQEAYERASEVNPEDPRAYYLRAVALARAWPEDPSAFAAPEARDNAIAVLEAGLRPGEMPHEQFAATVRAVLGLLYVQSGEIEKAREQASLMYRTTPEPPEFQMLSSALAGSAP